MTIFKYACEPQQDNGEVFLSEYLEDEMGRRKKGLVDLRTNKCNCRQCIGFSFPLVQSPASSRPATAAVDSSSRPTTAAKDTTPIVRSHASSSRPATVCNTTPFPPAAVHATHPFPIFPSLSVTTAPHWTTAPKESCFPYPPFFCEERRAWQSLRDSGSPCLGAPRHNPRCPRRCARSLSSPFM